MFASYLHSATLVSTMAMYLMTHHEHDAEKPKTSKIGHFQERFEHRFERFRASYRNLMESVMHHRAAFVAIFLGFCIVSGALVLFLGRDFFPSVDAGKFPGIEFFFQPADIVSQILNFGLPAPIDIQLVGSDYQENYFIAQQIANRIRHVPGAVDVHVQQMMDLPTLHLDVDRVRAQQLGISERDVAQNLLVSLSSSFQTTPSFWLNAKTGVSYNVAVMSPQYRVDSLQALMNTPVSNGTASPQVLANLAAVTPEMKPAVVNHYNVTPAVDVYASVDGRDLGAVAKDISETVQPFRGH